MLMQMKLLFDTTETDEERLVSFDDDIKVINLTKFIKTNQSTCINLKPIVKKGEKVKKGQVLAKDMQLKMVKWH